MSEIHNLGGKGSNMVITQITCDRLGHSLGEQFDLCSTDREFDFRDGDFLGSLYVWLDDFLGVELQTCLFIVVVPRKFAEIDIFEFGGGFLSLTIELALSNSAQ